jgi:NitT/TauT family transport system substrate-binding protein
MRRSSALAIGATFFLSPAFANAQTPTTTDNIRIGVIPAEIAGEIFYGIDAGFFAKNGLDVELQSFTNGAAIAAGVASGALDVGLSDLVSIISAHARGLPFGYLAPGMLQGEKRPAFANIVAKDSDIHEAKDFNGKTFGTNGLKNIGQISAEVWIDNNGGDSKTMKWIELPAPSIAPAIQQGTIQGAPVFEPVLSAAADGGNRVIYMDKKALAPVYLLSGWVATREWTAAHPGTAERFRTAIRQIAEWANKNQTLSAPILSKYTKIPTPIVDHMHRGEFAIRFDAAQIQPMIDAAVKYGIIAKSFPASELILGGAR